MTRMNYPSGQHVIYGYDNLDRLVQEVYYNSKCSGGLRLSLGNGKLPLSVILSEAQAKSKDPLVSGDFSCHTKATDSSLRSE